MIAPLLWICFAVMLGNFVVLAIAHFADDPFFPRANLCYRILAIYGITDEEYKLTKSALMVSFALFNLLYVYVQGLRGILPGLLLATTAALLHSVYEYWSYTHAKSQGAQIRTPTLVKVKPVVWTGVMVILLYLRPHF